MHLSNQHLQALYQAYCDTHLLWHDSAIFNLKQLELSNESHSLFLRKIEKRLRLGQLAEQFLFNQIETNASIELLAENIQIQKDRQTLGELDALIDFNGKSIHLEIIYKFYIYDPTLGCSEIEQWIGPNRKDSLIEKLNKLKERQLPLLYSEDCKATLKAMQLDALNFEQQVVFKAQLFVPYEQEISFKALNSQCICGFYIRKHQLESFKDCKFYIPYKLDWFLEPNDAIQWITLDDFINDANIFLNNNQAPLFWMKTITNEMSKGFLVWW